MKLRVRRNIRSAIAAWLALGLVLPAVAAVRMEVVTIRQSNDIEQEFVHRITHQGKLSRVRIRSDDSETFPDRTLFITDQQADTIHVVQPDGESCTSWGAGDFYTRLGSNLLAMTDRFDAEVSDPKLTKISEKSAGPMMGYAATETQWEFSASISAELLFKTFTWQVYRKITLWEAEIADLPENPTVIKPRWYRTGFPELDELMEASLASPGNYVLKSRIVQTIEAPIGNPPKLSISQEVTRFEELEEPLAEDFFSVSGCSEASPEQIEAHAERLMWQLYGTEIK